MKNMNKVNKHPVHQWVVWRGSVHSTGSWRPAPSAERVPSWSDHRAGSSPGLRTSWLTRQARPHGAWCRGHRWSSWKREVVREGRNGANEGKTERKQRGQTCYCHSGQTKRLSVCRVFLTELRLLCRLSDKVARLDLCSVFLCSRVNVWISMHQWECLSVDRDWTFCGTLVSWSRLWAQLWHRGRGEISEEFRESHSFESELMHWRQLHWSGWKHSTN